MIPRATATSEYRDISWPIRQLSLGNDFNLFEVHNEATIRGGKYIQSTIIVHMNNLFSGRDEVRQGCDA